MIPVARYSKEMCCYIILDLKTKNTIEITSDIERVKELTEWQSEHTKSG